MGETTLKIFALHYNIIYVVVANFIYKQNQNVFSLPCNHVWNSINNRFCINSSDVRRRKRFKKKSSKDFKIKIRFEQLLNYFWKNLFKQSKSNLGFDDLLKTELVCKPSHHLVLRSTFQCPNFVQWFSPQ